MEKKVVKRKEFKVDPDCLIDFLEALEDPRIGRTKKHSLIDILVIAICGAKNWIDIQDFGYSKEEWFSSNGFSF